MKGIELKACPKCGKRMSVYDCYCPRCGEEIKDAKKTVDFWDKFGKEK